MTSTYEIRNRFTNEVQATVKIALAKDAPESERLGAAVLTAIKAGANLARADLTGAYLTGAYLARARKARTAAFRAFQDAVRRGDTRDQHTTRKALYAATCDLLKAEGRAPVGMAGRVGG